MAVSNSRTSWIECEKPQGTMHRILDNFWSFSRVFRGSGRNKRAHSRPNDFLDAEFWEELLWCFPHFPEYGPSAGSQGTTACRWVNNVVSQNEDTAWIFLSTRNCSRRWASLVTSLVFSHSLALQGADFQVFSRKHTTQSDAAPPR